VIGRAGRPVHRRGARPGDGLWVTGALGGARAALAAWTAGRIPSPGARTRFAHPIPRIREGIWLAEQGATAMLDLSDGLGGDAEHLAAASDVALAIDLETIPVDPAVALVLPEGESASIFAARGGEDYELLAAMPEGFQGADFSLTRIGTVVAGSGPRFRHAGRAVALTGYDHFA
jgi:thiamine-monophosphate kinase